MRLVTGWLEPKSGQLVSIDIEVLQRTIAFCQSSANAAEAGGLLLGLRRGQNIEVKWLTAPHESDTRKRFGFIREMVGHAATALLRWSETGFKADYVGEWHTHPEQHPTPSSTDISEWLRLEKARTDNRPLFFLIVGTVGFYACLCRAGCLYPLTPIEVSNAALNG